MRAALLLGLASLAACGGAPQPERSRVSLHGVSGTGRDESGFEGDGARLRRTGGDARYEFNNGSGLLFNARIAVQRQTGIEARHRSVITALGVSTGRINRRSGIEAGLTGFPGGDLTLPWIRFMLGDMATFRVGVTFGPDEPLVAVNLAHLHLGLIFEAVEVQVGLASAGRVVDSGEGADLRIGFEDDAGPVLTAVLRWALPHFGIDAGFMAGAFDVARLGVFYDFE